MTWKTITGKARRLFRQAAEAEAVISVTWHISEDQMVFDRGRLPGAADPKVIQHPALRRVHPPRAAREEVLVVPPFALDKLKDRVVDALVRNGTVRPGQVAAAWPRWHHGRRYGSQEALWRELVRDPEVDKEAVYATAAQVYAFPPIDIDLEGSVEHIKAFRAEHWQAPWRNLIIHRLMPVREKGHDAQERLILATDDPTSLTAHHLIRALDCRAVEVRYAPEATMRTLIREAFKLRNRNAETPRPTAERVAVHPLSDTAEAAQTVHHRAA